MSCCRRCAEDGVDLSGRTATAAAAPASVARRERPAEAPLDASTALALTETAGAHLLGPAADGELTGWRTLEGSREPASGRAKRRSRRRAQRRLQGKHNSDPISVCSSESHRRNNRNFAIPVNAPRQLQARHGQAHAATICGEAVALLVGSESSSDSRNNVLCFDLATKDVPCLLCSSWW